MPPSNNTNRWFARPSLEMDLGIRFPKTQMTTITTMAAQTTNERGLLLEMEKAKAYPTIIDNGHNNTQTVPEIEDGSNTTTVQVTITMEIRDMMIMLDRDGDHLPRVGVTLLIPSTIAMDHPLICTILALTIHSIPMIDMIDITISTRLMEMVTWDVTAIE